MVLCGLPPLHGLAAAVPAYSQPAVRLQHRHHKPVSSSVVLGGEGYAYYSEYGNEAAMNVGVGGWAGGGGGMWGVASAILTILPSAFNLAECVALVLRDGMALVLRDSMALVLCDSMALVLCDSMALVLCDSMALVLRDSMALVLCNSMALVLCNSMALVLRDSMASVLRDSMALVLCDSVASAPLTCKCTCGVCSCACVPRACLGAY